MAAMIKNQMDSKTSLVLNVKTPILAWGKKITLSEDSTRRLNIARVRAYYKDHNQLPSEYAMKQMGLTEKDIFDE